MKRTANENSTRNPLRFNSHASGFRASMICGLALIQTNRKKPTILKIAGLSLVPVAS